MRRHVIIAVDGPAASGKGTIARRLAQSFGLAYLDTGLLYRAVGRDVVAQGGDPANPEVAAAAARLLDPATLADPTLRDQDMGSAASKVAAHPGVRSALIDLQRNFAAQPGGAVLDGRDIGTVICPAAAAKLFVTAAMEVRAERRFKELAARPGAPTLAQVLDDLRIRDERDSSRGTAPLRQAEDAVVLDTTAMTVDEAVAAAEAIVAERIR